MYFKEAFEAVKIGGTIKHESGDALKRCEHATVGSAAAIVVEYSAFMPGMREQAYNMLVSDKWEIEEKKEKKTITYTLDKYGAAPEHISKMKPFPNAKVTVEWSE